jgi:phospholipase C
MEPAAPTRIATTGASVAMSGTNIGDELNAAGISWGYFKRGFRPTTTFAQATGGTQPTSDFIPHEFANATFYQSVPNATEGGLCNADHAIGSAPGETGQFGYNNDYSDHQEPFQYYASTANPHHLSVPTGANGMDTLAGLEEIGHDTQSYVNGQPQFDTPNHQYDMTDFDQLVAAIGRGELSPSALPAVSFLKASTYETGHAADSDPADEQQFVTREINALERTPDWSHTAVILMYDDSDGWYDHAFRPAQLRRSQPLGSVLDHQLDRVQLAPARHRRLVRPGAQRDRPPQRHPVRPRGPVRFPGSDERTAVLEPEHRPA